MKFIKSIKQNSKKIILSMLAIALIAVPAASFAGFFPQRPTKDWNNTEDRKGFDKVVFNSFVNTPYYGDERHFFDSREGTGNDSADNYKDVLNNVADGDELTLRVYVHNNGNQSLNGNDLNGPTVAKNTKVRFKLPTGTAQNLKATSYISADNATPAVVSDTAEFVGDSPFNIEYIPGSATLVTGYNGGSSFALSDEIVNGGAHIGYDKVNGVVPGCFEFQAFVYIKVKVKAPAVKLDKKVKVSGGSFKDSVEAKPGDTVQWLISYENTGTSQINNTVIKDELPSNLDVVDGSVKLVDANHTSGLTLDDNDLFDANGVNAGSYTSGSNGYITFETKIADEKDLKECVTTLRNIAKVRADGVPEQEDDAEVIVTKEVCEEPSYVCNVLTAEKLGPTKYKFTTNATASNGATIKQYRYNFGDGSDELLTDQSSVTHTYANNGTYVISVEVDFVVDGKTVTKTAKACEVTITTDSDQPEVPTTLPSTGPANIIGIFAAVSVAAGLAHKFVYSRRFM